MHPRLEFLYLGAMIAIAAAIEGNPLAGFLACLAIVLAFVVIKPRTSSLSRPPHEVRGREERADKGRASRPLASHGERMTMFGKRKKSLGSNEVGQKLYELVTQSVQAAILTQRDEKGINGGEAVFVGAMSALGAFIPTVLLIAKKPEWVENFTSPDEVPDEIKDRVMAEIITPEAMTYLSLLVSKMLIGINPKDGSTTTEFGPHIMWAALLDWEKMFPDKKADDYMMTSFLEAARSFGRNPKLPEDLLRNRREYLGSSHTVN